MDSLELKQICIAPSLSIKRAVDVLNEGHKRIALIVRARKLLGVVADSDIRKAILNGISFETPVSTIMVKTPVIATPDMSERSILALMKQTQVYQIPIVDYEGDLVDLKLIDDLLTVPPQAEAFILAGGLGKRLLPITKSIPKPLIKVGGKPLLLRLIDSLIAVGITKITLALNYKAEKIKRSVTENLAYTGKVFFVKERSKLGTAGALKLFNSPPKVPVIVINGDILTKVDYASMLGFHYAESNEVTVAVRTEKFQIPFGVSTIQGTQISKIEEKPILSFFVNAGIYILNPSVLKQIPRNSEFDMPQLLGRCIENQQKVGCFPVHEYWIDIGRPNDLKKAKREFRKNFRNSRS